MGAIQSFPLGFGALETKHKEHGPKLNTQNSYLFICLYVCMYGTVPILMQMYVALIYTYIFIKLFNERMLGVFTSVEMLIVCWSWF